ncbi:MAG TPA: hypothetical protein VF800_02700 [Telluria sp.]|jgi:hypothetical protein
MFSREPLFLGRFVIDCPELMFVQYMPIAMPGTELRIPKNLWCFAGLIEQAECRASDEQYIYLTAKRLFVGPHCLGNRPGWHTDGFGTDDINYIWSDTLPTEFCVGQRFDLSDDHDISLAQMAQQASPENFRTYAPGSLLQLDSTIVHRAAQPVSEGYRTFVKVSVSRHQYNLIGNAHNYLFDYEWPMVERQASRNHPIGA